MRIKRLQGIRLVKLLPLLLGLAIAVGLILNALRQNINLYFTPNEVKSHPELLKEKRIFRLGGLVLSGSHLTHAHLKHEFVLTDGSDSIRVHFKGLLPDLFREKQGIVTQGYLNERGDFMAQEVLAKHDENYHPPNIEKRATV